MARGARYDENNSGGQADVHNMSAGNPVARQVWYMTNPWVVPCQGVPKGFEGIAGRFVGIAV